jgi:hypothetical protein
MRWCWVGPCSVLRDYGFLLPVRGCTQCLEGAEQRRGTRKTAWVGLPTPASSLPPLPFFSGRVFARPSLVRPARRDERVPLGILPCWARVSDGAQARPQVSGSSRRPTVRQSRGQRPAPNVRIGDPKRVSKKGSDPLAFDDFLQAFGSGPEGV